MDNLILNPNSLGKNKLVDTKLKEERRKKIKTEFLIPSHNNLTKHENISNNLVQNLLYRRVENNLYYHAV